MSNSQNLQKKAKAEQAKRELARRHLKDFAEYTYDGYMSNWHTELICDALEKVEKGEIRYLIIEAPPRHSKSLHVSQLFPAWVVGRDKDADVIVSSYSGDLATTHGRETRNLMGTKRYQNVFETRLAHDSTAKGKWNTDGKGAYNAVGVGGSTTGKGAKFAIVDDSVKDRKEAESELIRDGVWDWFRSVLRTRLTPDGRIVVMQTRWHLDDLIGRITTEDSWVDYFDYLKNGKADDKWVRLQLPAIATVGEPYRKEGEPLWGERYDLKELADIKKSLGPYEWTALYQQNPISSEHQEFRKDWFRPITHTEFADVRKKQKHRLLTIDTAVSQKETADYTGFTDNLITDDNTWHFQAWKIRLSPHILIEELFKLHLQNEYTRIGVEETIYLMVIKPFIDEKMREREIYLPIVPLKHKQTQKEVRIRGLVPRYAAGGIKHVEGACDELEFELLTFPNGKHDDVADSAAYQQQLLEDLPKDTSNTADFYERLKVQRMRQGNARPKAGLR